MSGAQLSPYEYALNKVIVLFGVLLIQLDEAGLTRTYRDVLRYCELENIHYLVLRYVNTGAGPYEEWAEERLHEVEVLSSYNKETGFGGDSICRALTSRTQEVESWERRGKMRIDRRLY
jgi:hypothetical protein